MADESIPYTPDEAYNAPRLRRYSELSCLSFSLLLVSPPQTMSTLLTMALACPTRGRGTSPNVCIKLAVAPAVEKEYRSFLTESLTSPPNMYSSPEPLATGGRE